MDKKSWFHRLYFDYLIAHKLVKRYNVDKILSLQNLIIPRVKGVKQYLYVHQSLPFVDYRFKFKDNKKLWVYQNIIGKGILNSIRKADHIIVQTEWMKELCAEKSGVKNSKIEVKPPEVNIQVKKYFSGGTDNMKTFFYPAGGSYYKNHRIIVEACKRIIDEGITDFNIIFTLKGDETDHITYLHNIAKEMELPISFIGPITREEVYDYYTKSILIYPSYIETFGLPMLEAKLHEGIILASDCPFSREILGGYKNAYYFDPFNTNTLKAIMANLISGELVYQEAHSSGMKNLNNKGKKIIDICL